MARLLVAAGAHTYRHIEHEGERLDGVPLDVALVAELLTSSDFGYTRHWLDESSGDLDLPVPDLRRRLSRWLAASERADDICVVYLCGHGGIEQQHHYLLGPDSEPNDLIGTALAADDIGRMWRGNAALLVLIDACRSGWGASELAVDATLRDRAAPAGRRPDSGLTVLASAGAKQEADQSRFAPALVAALRDPPAGDREMTVSVRLLADAINERFAADQRTDQWVRAVATPGAGADPFFVNLRRREDLPPIGLDVASQRAPRARDLALHWGPRSRGVEDAADVGWHFTGRVAVLDELVTWAKDPAGDFRIRAVTGRAGTGKSAVLGRLVALSDAEFLASMPANRRPAEQWPKVDAAILARGKPLTVIASELAAALNLEAGDPDQVVEAITGRGDALIVVDALEEAVAPATVALRLLVPLAERALHAGSSVRLVIGCRPELLAQLDPVVAPINLESEDYFSRDDVRDYVYSVITADESAYQDVPELAGATADWIAERAGKSFLIARLMARSLAVARRALSLRELQASPFPTNVGAAIDRDIETRFDRTDQARVREMLIPLAYARGAGLPRHLWWRVAKDLSGRGSLGDITWLLDHAGSYVVEDIADGRSVYRLWHAAVTQHLAKGLDEREAHSTFSDVGVESVPGRDGRLLWAAADPYVRRHLAEHAAGAGRLGELVADPGYLVAAEPSYLLPVLASAQGTDERRVELVFRRIVHVLGEVTTDDERAAYLLAAARQVGNKRLAESIEATLSLAWRVRWTTVPPDRSRVLGRFDSQPNQQLVTVGTSSDGNPIAIAADGREVRQWDLQTAEPVAPPVELSSWPTAVAATPDGRAVVVATFDRLTRVLTGEHPFGEPIMLPPQTSSIYSTLMVTSIAGRDVIVAVAVRSLYRWDFWSGERQAGPIDLDGNPAESILVLDGEPERGARLVLGRSHGELELRRLHDGSVVQDLGAVHAHGVMALARIRGLDGQVGIVSAGADGELRRWQLVDDTLEAWPWPAPKPAVSQPLWSLAADARGGLFVTGGVDIRLWDAVSGAPRGALQGHEGPIRGIAVWSTYERRLICSHGIDSTIRRWDGADAVVGAVEPDPIGALSRGATLDREGQRILLCAKGGGRIELRDFDSGILIDTRTVSGSWVYGLHAVPGSAKLVVAGLATGEVIVTDLDTGTELSRVRAFSLGPTEELSDLVVTQGEDPLVITCCRFQDLRWWKLNAPDPSPALTELEVRAISLAVHSDQSGEHLLYLDDNGDVWSIDLETLLDDGFDSPEPALVFSTGNAKLTSMAVSSGTSRIVLGGVDRVLQTRDMTGSMLATVQLESWINDIVVIEDAVAVITNQGVLRLDGLLAT